ncbi:unnamed protein product [Blepharisma stoltei]|uniref:RGS domain-containing protein n=1 Tax=Blepharisma stoltei TaxID=1481888 RepID=A0AAU9JXW2_9CILI|nr:unnamed protein product [Blepharisma stoltei]
MWNQTLIIEIIWPTTFALLTIIFLWSGIYVHKNREYHELFAKSPGILIITIVLNYVNTITAMSFGFLTFFNEENSIFIVLPILVIYSFARHALYISIILKIYRLELIKEIRSGSFLLYKAFLKKKDRITAWWNIKVLVLYSTIVSSTFISVLALKYAFNYTGNLNSTNKRDIDLSYDFIWLIDVVLEEIGFSIYYCRIRNVKNVGLIKTELMLYLAIWSFGIIAPFCPDETFHLYAVPARNLSTLFVIIFVTRKQSKTNIIIPVPRLIDSRLILENYSVYESFQSFVAKSKNKNWKHFLDILVAINVYKYDPCIERAENVHKIFNKIQDVLPEFFIKKIKSEWGSNRSVIEIDADFFSEIEEYIYHQFDIAVYPDFCRSDEYLDLSQEMHEII